MIYWWIILYWTLTDPPIQIYVNRIKNRIVFKITTGYKSELWLSETTNLLGSSKQDVKKDKDGEDVPKLESVEIVLVDCNLVNNSYQLVSKILFTFLPNKPFASLINIQPHYLTILNITNKKFSFIEIWFTNHNSKLL